jgi:flagellar motility protein MotE (MotC chaperone)
MKFKKDAEVTTSDFWYDLFDGGYIKPHKLLEDKSEADKVEEAMKTLEKFKESAYEQDVVTDM